MSERKWTAGPWRADEKDRVWSGNEKIVRPFPARRPDETRLEGECWLDMRKRTEPERKAIDAEVTANAHLIAAAPELYEEDERKDTALRRIYAAAEAIMSGEDPSRCAAHDICQMVITALRAEEPISWPWQEYTSGLPPHRALAKARGEQS